MIKKGTKENYSSNKTNISETSQELAYQQLLLEKRDSEQFLRTIAPNYMGVYVLNRKTDLFRDILGPDYFRAIVQDKGGYYSLAIKKYNATFVLEEDQSVLQYALNYDRIYEILLSGKSVNLSYRKKDGTFVSLKLIAIRIVEMKKIYLYGYLPTKQLMKKEKPTNAKNAFQMP